jgi:hypothetical protein
MLKENWWKWKIEITCDLDTLSTLLSEPENKANTNNNYNNILLYISIINNIYYYYISSSSKNRRSYKNNIFVRSFAYIAVL